MHILVYPIGGVGVNQFKKNLMRVFWFLGQFEDAISEHETELRLCEALEDSLGRAVAHRRIGECLSELGKYEEALQHQQQYLDLSHKCDSVLEQQRAYATLGRIHYQHAEQITDTMEVEQSLKQAEAAFNKSLDVCKLLKEATSDSELAEMKARIFMNLGNHLFSVISV